MKKLTTLELVLQLTRGALLVPLKKTACILGLEPQTIRNRLCEKKFELTPVKIGRRNFFKVTDIANTIDTSTILLQKPTRGRPRKSKKT